MSTKPPIHFERQHQAVLRDVDGPGPVRMSTAARLLRESGAEGLAAELERDAKAAAPWCQQCGRKTDDPVIGLLGDRVAFACPHCSGPEVFARWEAEGKSA